jgi:hypothetical protein
MHMPRSIMMVIVLAAAFACRSTDADVAVEDSAHFLTVAPPPVAYDSTAQCPADGAWSVCSVMYRLKRAGFDVTRDSAIAREPGLGQEGMRLYLGKGSMNVFLYVDSANRKVDQRRLDSTLFLRPEWESRPSRRTLLSSANMLVLMEIENGRNRERIADALLAGPPQGAPK